jgi:hypothetical protein
MLHQMTSGKSLAVLIHLLKKDMIVYHSAFIKTVLVIFAMDNFFILFDPSWEIYVVIGIGQISYLIAFFGILEKVRKGEMLLCSLPAGRVCIVVSRYLSSALIAMAGLILITLNAHLMDFFVTRTPDDLHTFINPYVLFIAVLYFTLFISIFTPAVLYLRHIWVNIVLLAVCTAAFMLATIHIHQSLSLSYDGFAAKNPLIIALLMMVLIIALIISLLFTIQMYPNKEV